MEPLRPNPRAPLAALLSFLFPGLGQAYNGQSGLAWLLAGPTLVLVVAVIAVMLTGTSQLLAAAGALIVQISTNQVFDGSLDRPYTVDDEPNPINPYGASKLTGEKAVAAVNPLHLIVRTAWLFGPSGSDFPAKILPAADRADAAGEPLRVVADEVGSPTYRPDLAAALVTLLPADPVHGIYHLVNEGSASRAEWAAEVLRLADRTTHIKPISGSSWVRASMPPASLVLALSSLPRGASLRPWRDALAVHLRSSTAGRVAER